jgi:two-component system cell cycle sensor histidine kinase/response regulator CckA
VSRRVEMNWRLKDSVHAMTSHRSAAARLARVLIVEDELLLAWHIESLVREQGHEVCGLVPDGEAAVEQAADLDAELVLMDVRLAGHMDGIEAARLIREQRGTPVIFITAHGDETTRARINTILPGTPVLAKPISAERLREAIESALLA